MSYSICLVTIELIPRHRTRALQEALIKVMKIYTGRSFIIQSVLMDMDFKKNWEKMDQVVINTKAKKEHIAVIERRIILVKERCQHGIINTLPLKIIPKRLII